MSAHVEERFEEAIEATLLASGWHRGQRDGYRADLGIDGDQLFTFIGATQQDRWDAYCAFYDEQSDAQHGFVHRLASEIDSRGTLDVLRQGVKDRGQHFRLAYFRPAHTLAEDALADYAHNRLSVTRQLAYSVKTPGKELDLALFVNGIPVATAELKNPVTGQTVEDAKHQYRHDRDPAEPLFARRALVHFAIDPDLVFLTTRLAGRNTQFLPFNTGSGGAGNTGSSGNPPATVGHYRTSYLWEQVWQPDAWLDIIRRFMHRQQPREAKGGKAKPERGTLIFPRYHQWHAVRELTTHAAAHGSGHNYLIEHSAGSGKSNTIAWLAHRLSNLYSSSNESIFDKVIVVSDRTVLNRQLQDTISQFEHVPGLVRKIGDSDGAQSEQLAQALAGATAKILIVTLQTFPYVLGKISELRGNRFAVIVDEAHSSQSGEAAAALKRVLATLGSDDIDADDDLLTAAALARGKHDRLSYFAFTATPKQKTIELFGTRRDSELRPFHIYSMRQAIDEGFILDVLRNYVTYQTYWRLANGNPDDREVDERKAAAALARFAVLSPNSMQQRAELIVEHFITHTRARLGGRAKAMVVCGSRNHAVKLYRAIQSYVDMRGYPGCGTLVAFSGSLEVDGVEADTVTEPALNGVSALALPNAFGYTRADDPHAATSTRPEYRILVVADKYQTGFDQPLLTTMYVDKPLSGVAAVQTLSRLNRTHPRKSQDDLFVLDFVNEAVHIQDSFRPFYEATITTPTDPNLVYDAERAVLDHQLIDPAELAAFGRAYVDAQQGSAGPAWEKAHAKLYNHTDPARDRFVHRFAGDPDAAEAFRHDLHDYVRKYGFLAQVCGFADGGLERLYLFGRMLLPRLPKREDPTVDLGDVDLTHLRITKTGEHDVGLAPEGEQALPGLGAGGIGAQQDPRKKTLSELIADLNERFGTNLGENDIVAGAAEAAKSVPGVAAAALVNNLENFGHVFDDVFEDKMAERLESDTLVFRQFNDDNEFNDALKSIARRYAYESLRRDVA